MNAKKLIGTALSVFYVQVCSQDAEIKKAKQRQQLRKGKRPW